ncbi:hypothetical protein B4U80_08887 [Leptotrombidium deliense]|uniref:Uncharacterized protein n=1 Tax=Leptotrombidium deliense TaxID=299467 RepID=A0A443S0T0_9ACAR|nr:hypothetical protein B4U80_08887 [Leptotrombidium deliense]
MADEFAGSVIFLQVDADECDLINGEYDVTKEGEVFDKFCGTDMAIIKSLVEKYK